MRQLINALLKYKNPLLYVGLLTISLIFLNQRSFYHNSVFSKISLSISSGLGSYKKDFSNYFRLIKINNQLTKENEKLKSLELIYNENKNLKLDKIESFGFNVIIARIIKNSYNNARNYIIIDKGIEDQIEVEMGVISNDGIIGVINQTTEKFSSILSILHRDFKFNVSFKKNGVFGSLSWKGNNPKKMELEDISTLNSVSIGDTIVTGGMSDYFPYGIPIGSISKLKKPEFEGYYDIEVDLFSNLTQKEFVYVLKNKDLDEIKKLNVNE